MSEEVEPFTEVKGFLLRHQVLILKLNWFKMHLKCIVFMVATLV